MSEVEQRSPGRPCRTCEHAQRSEIESLLISDEVLVSSVSSEYGISIAALRRHARHHMIVSAQEVQDHGLEAVDIVVRLSRLSERLQDAAALAEQRGDIPNLVRTTDAIRRIDRDLLVLAGVRHEQVTGRLDMGQAVIKAVGRLAKKVPAVGEAIAAELEAADRRAAAEELRDLVSRNKELNA